MATTKKRSISSSSGSGSSSSKSDAPRTPSRCAARRVTDAILEKVRNNLSGTVKISGSDRPDLRIVELLEAMHDNTSTLTLELSEINIGDDLMHAVAEMLRKNDTLECLDLSLTNLSDEGIEILAPSLKSTSLDRLLLNDNRISDKGANELKKYRPNHLDISLRGNTVTEHLQASLRRSEEYDEESESEEDENESSQASTQQKQAPKAASPPEQRKKARTASKEEEEIANNNNNDNNDNNNSASWRCVVM